MLHQIYKGNVRLGNALYVDLKIPLSQNVPSHQKITRNGESKYILSKKVIVHATMAKIIVTARCMHLWQECLATTNGKIMVRLKTETEQLCKRGDRVQDSLWNKSSV